MELDPRGRFLYAARHDPEPAVLVYDLTAGRQVRRRHEADALRVGYRAHGRLRTHSDGARPSQPDSRRFLPASFGRWVGCLLVEGRVLIGRDLNELESIVNEMLGERD